MISLKIFLDNYNVPFTALDCLSEISTKVKIHVIDIVRKWPLYFCRFYTVVEERVIERVHLFVGLSETGIRLISLNVDQIHDPLIIQDHFE